MSKNNSKFQLIWMILISVGVQVLTLIKSSIIASNFGAGIELDAFNLSNNITSFVTTLAASGITTVILPAYVRKADRKSTDSFLTGIFLLIATLYALIFVARHPLVSLLSGKTGQFVAYTDGILGFTILIQSVAAIVSMTAAFYQSEDKFVIPKIINMFTGFLSVIILLLMKEFTIYQYVMVLLSCSVAQLIIDVSIAVACGFRFSISFAFCSKETVALFKVFLPMVISSGVYQIHSLVDSIISSGLAEGNLTVLTYANQIVSAVNSLIIGNLTLYAYPRIVRAHAGSIKDGMHTTSRYAISFHLIICCLITGFFACGKDVISLIFRRGKFDESAVFMTFCCAMIYIFGQQANIIRDLIYRFYYADKDTVTTLKNSMTVSALNIVLSIILARFMGLYGIVIGTILSSSYSLFAILGRTKKKYALTPFAKKDVLELLKNEVALLFSCTMIWILQQVVYFEYLFLNILFFGMISVAMFILSLFTTKSRTVLRLIKRSEV